MKFIFSFAIKNIFRNKKRSIITLIAIMAAVIVSVFSQGFADGTMNDLMSNYINYETGYIRIITKNYLDRERFFPVNEFIEDPNAITSTLNNIPDIIKTEQRIRFGLMVGEGENTVNGVGVGVDLMKTSIPLKKHLIKGKIFSAGLFIGEGLAKKLNVKIGDKLLLASKTSEGGLNGIKLKIKGIFRFNITYYDDFFFFIDLKSAQKLLKMGKGVSEILLYAKNYKSVPEILPKIRSKLKDRFVVQSFQEQIGSLWNMFRLEKYVMFFFEIIILILASFVIVNTMMQSVFERLNEIGTLKSLGMPDNSILLDFTIEGGIIGLFGGILGGILGYLLTILMSKYGIDYKVAMEGTSLPFSYIWRTTPELLFSIIIAIAAGIISTIAAIFPAKYAKKLTAAETLREN